MTKYTVILCACLLALVCRSFAEPAHPRAHNKVQGMTIMMIPTGPRTNDLSAGGFAVVASAGLGQQPPKPFRTAEEVFAFIQAHPDDPGHTGTLDVNQRGIWNYAEDATDVYYSPEAKTQYNKLLRLCEDHGIRVFLGKTEWKEASPDMRPKPPA